MPSLWSAIRWLLLAVALGALAVASFHPFEVDIDFPQRRTNRLERLPDGTLRFNSVSAARTGGPAEWLTAAIAASEVTVYIEARTLDSPQLGPARLFTVSKDTGLRNLLVGQAGSDLTVRVRRVGSDANGLPPLVVPGVFADREWHELRLDVDASAIRIFVDGELASREWQSASPFTSWSADFRVSLGDELTGDRGWRGELRRVEVRVGDQRFDYLDAARIETPEHFWYVPERWRSFTDASRAGGFIDSTQHLLALSLLGASLVVAFGRGTRLPLLLAVALGTIVTTEVAQLAFAGRHPSYVDLLTGGAGATLGILATRAVWQGASSALLAR